MLSFLLATTLLSAGTPGALRAPAPYPAEEETLAVEAEGSGAEQLPFAPTIVLGGRLMSDWTFASSDDSYAPGVESGVEFRRLRLIASGMLDTDITHRIEVDFAGSEVEIKDAFAAIDLGGSRLRVGRFWEPFGLEQQIDAAALTFLERAPSFSPGRGHGLEWSGSNEDQTSTWALGVFKETEDDGAATEDTWNVTARATLLPLEDGEDLLHVGLGLSRQGRPRIAEAQPGSHLAGVLLSPPLGESETEGPLLAGLEAAGILGPWSFQAEFQLASAENGDPFATYVYASRFLTTGDSRRYDRSRGTFAGVAPKAPRGEGGGGALEAALRVSHIDFTEAAASGVPAGGAMTNVTAGLNWYLTARTRLMLDYTESRVDADNDGGSETAELLGLRFQVDF